MMMTTTTIMMMSVGARMICRRPTRALLLLALLWRLAYRLGMPY
jgi:hypothetical protein